MWRIIVDWIGPGLPKERDETDSGGLILGILALGLLTLSLPLLFHI